MSRARKYRPPLSAADVLNTKFPATKFREGYDQEQVDAFLDRIVEALRAREGDPAADLLLTPADVLSVTFEPTKFREGYDQDEVDDFLDRVHGTLTAGAAGDPPTDAAVPGLIAPATGWRRLFSS